VTSDELRKNVDGRGNTNHFSLITNHQIACGDLGGQSNGLLVPENANGLLELLGLERFL